VDDGTFSNKQWPPEASIIYPLSGDIKLTDQHTLLAQVIRNAIKAQNIHLLTTDAFPHVESRVRLAREWLSASATEIKHTKSIRMRVNEDDAFLRALQVLVRVIPQCFCMMMMLISL
jgi:hypothetical protein